MIVIHVIITVRNEVAKVMFLHVCVCPQWGDLGRCPPPGIRCTPQDQVHPPGLGAPPGPGTPPGTRYTPRDQVHPPGPGTPPRDQVHPLGPGTPPGTRYTTPADGYYCERYASYWNEFLLQMCITDYITYCSFTFINSHSVTLRHNVV